jgi:dihydroorotate dehydrogenase electron transfer subunit
VRIQGIREENPTVKTIVFQDKYSSEAKPGQFVMVWIPGVDEVPMSLSSTNSGGFSSITVAEVGEATTALHQRKVGDLLGIRGPYGNSFALASGKVMIVGGGTGLTPLVPLVDSLSKLPTKISFLIGAKTQDELFFLETIEKAVSKVKVTTEDGSYGLKGLVTDVAGQILKKERFNMIYACGPEKMMLKLCLLAEQYKTAFQASLERYIRCGIGICGSCCIGEYRICKDGPVFSGQQLRKVQNEFGRFKRDVDGSKVSL